MQAHYMSTAEFRAFIEIILTIVVAIASNTSRDTLARPTAKLIRKAR